STAPHTEKPPTTKTKSIRPSIYSPLPSIYSIYFSAFLKRRAACSLLLYIFLLSSFWGFLNAENPIYKTSCRKKAQSAAEKKKHDTPH
ncbi:MAG: hypothetical protein QXQ91_04120, partial [Nanopusillaceae archaeon]